MLEEVKARFTKPKENETPFEIAKRLINELNTYENLLKRELEEVQKEKIKLALNIYGIEA